MEFLPALLMFVLFAIDVPIAFAIAIAALSFFFFGEGLPLRTFVQKFVQVTDSFPLLAVPFFICAGSIMNHAGITRRLLNLADALVGHWVGGLGQANVLLATLMGGLSASANADAPSYSEAFETCMPVRLAIIDWYSYSSCSVPWLASAW